METQINYPSFPNQRLPEWLENLRPWQPPAIEEAVEHFKNGKKVVFLSAPTGAGKTLIGEMIARRMRELNGSAWFQALYVCTTKTLQDQFAADFEYARVLKGRGNYPIYGQTKPFPYSALDCNPKTAYPCKNCPPKHSQELGATYSPLPLHCLHCHPLFACPYRVAKDEAKKAPVAVLNTAYWLSAIKYTELFAQPSLLIVDEADVFEQTVADFSSVTIPSSLRTKLDIPLPDKVTKPESWREWLKDVVIPKLGKYLRTLKGEENRREAQRIVQLIEKLEWTMEGEHGIGEEAWVFDGYEKTKGPNKSNIKETVALKPVWLMNILRDTILPRPKHILMMSASFVSVSFYAKLLGLKNSEWAQVTVESPFDPANRPIIFQPATAMTRKNRDNWPKTYKEIARIINDHSMERVLVHTHSYQLTRELHMYLKRAKLNGRKIFTYRDARDRNTMLEAWLNSPDGIILAPSFDRGIDLKGELCRVQIIAKIPYPYIGDGVVAARMRTKEIAGTKNAGQMWFNIETLRTVVQQCGRVVRTGEDWGITYVVDESFSGVVNTARKVGPKWWLDAVIRPGLNYSKIEQHLGVSISKRR